MTMTDEIPNTKVQDTLDTLWEMIQERDAEIAHLNLLLDLLTGCVNDDNQN